MKNDDNRKSDVDFGHAFMGSHSAFYCDVARW